MSFPFARLDRQRIAAVGLVALAAFSGDALAQDRSGGWQAMTFHDFTVPSSTDPLQTLIWPDLIREENAYVTTELKRPLKGKNARVTALSATFRDAEGRNVIVTTALARRCESGANDKGADIEPSTCPVRIATIQAGKLLTLKTGDGCYIDHADPTLPAKNRTDSTYVRFDQGSGAVQLRTTVGGRDVATCARNLQSR